MLSRPNLFQRVVRARTSLVAVALALPALAIGGALAAGEDGVVTQACLAVQQWYDELLATHPSGTAVPLIHHPSDEELAAFGLPSARELAGLSFQDPVLFGVDGTRQVLDKSILAPAGGPNDKGNGGGKDASQTQLGPSLVAYGGTGCLGIRPGAWMFNIQPNSISWCTLAHVYGSEGAYDISTAGHCAKTGDRITLVGLVGNSAGLAGAVLLDIGTTAQSHDAGIGNDWALIDVRPELQSLVTPEMCFWGGPFLGSYTEQGEVLDVSVSGNGKVTVTPNPDPTLVQGIVHYGHGAGIGAGGTPRAGAGEAWGSTAFYFVGVIAPGDSGSGANTATSQAAGIITHIIVDPLMRNGIGIAAGTRVTAVGTPAQGLPVGIPAPLP